MRPDTKAFPSTAEHNHPGMNLRDHFASVFIGHVHPENVMMDPEMRQKLAAYAYQIADAMLIARED